jgi:NADH-quinone oxidoreductase subunit J
MVPISFYAACAMASVGLLILLKPRNGTARFGASALALSGLALALATVARAVDGAAESPLPIAAMSLCALVACFAGVRVITHPRPVYCALYFVLVVVSTAAMYVLLRAEFMAFSLIIVYAGAILITYLFVLMLAQQSPTDTHGAEAVNYDRVPREPASAVFAGLVVVAVLGSAVFAPRSAAIAQMDQANAVRRGWDDLSRMPDLLLARAKAIDPTVVAVQADEHGRRLRAGSGSSPTVLVSRTDGAAPAAMELPASALPDNTSRVGMALVSRFPISLELAGVLLLMAMLGAVVLARRQADIADDERRAHAGLPRHHDHAQGGDA